MSTDARTPLALSPIPRHLGQLFALLAAELSGPEDGSLGPCVEFLLKNQVLNSLVKLSAKDDPAGTQCEVLRWFVKITVELDADFLVHSAVHKPL